METQLLEINLISAQGLKTIGGGRRMQTYAIAWVDADTKLRTRVDRVGGENPTWNDKFIFRVTKDFLARETSAVAVEIYAVGFIKDTLVGTVRFLVSNCISVDDPASAPAFAAVQVRRPSGRFHGVLNVAAMVTHGSDFAALTGATAIGYRDLTGESFGRRSFRRMRRARSEQFPSVGSFDSFSFVGDLSDGGDSSTTTSSSSTPSTALKEWNGPREAIKSDGVGMLCGLALQRRIQLSPSDPNFHCFTVSENKNC